MFNHFLHRDTLHYYCFKWFSDMKIQSHTEYNCICHLAQVLTALQAREMSRYVGLLIGNGVAYFLMSCAHHNVVTAFRCHVCVWNLFEVIIDWSIGGLAKGDSVVWENTAHHVLLNDTFYSVMCRDCIFPINGNWLDGNSSGGVGYNPTRIGNSEQGLSRAYLYSKNERDLKIASSRKCLVQR